MSLLAIVRAALVIHGITGLLAATVLFRPFEAKLIAPLLRGRPLPAEFGGEAQRRTVILVASLVSLALAWYLGTPGGLAFVARLRAGR